MDYYQDESIRWLMIKDRGRTNICWYPGTFLYWPNPPDVVGAVTPVASEVISLLLVRILNIVLKTTLNEWKYIQTSVLIYTFTLTYVELDLKDKFWQKLLIWTCTSEISSTPQKKHSQICINFNFSINSLFHCEKNDWKKFFEETI